MMQRGWNDCSDHASYAEHAPHAHSVRHLQDTRVGPQAGSPPAGLAPEGWEPVDAEAIRRAHPLLTVIEHYGVAVQGAGARRTALCPFHDDNEPSLTAYLDSQRFHCFGCGASGDVIEFVERMEGVGFREAVRKLDAGDPSTRSTTRRAPKATRDSASSAVPLTPVLAPRRVSRSTSHSTSRSTSHSGAANDHDTGRHSVDGRTMLTSDLTPDLPPDLPYACFPFNPPWHPLQLRCAMLTAAAAIYREALLRSPAASAYLDGRGIPAAVAQAAYLGYSDGVSLARYLSLAPALLASARQSGLIDARGQETLRGRLIIPEIRGGLCVWLHGRILPTATSEAACNERGHARAANEPMPPVRRAAAPKYRGCSLTKPLFGVGLSTLGGDARYSATGLYRGVLQRGIIVVEGAFDVLTLLSWHIPVRCVALIGTHASAEQLDHLTALAAAGSIWIALDADPPGNAGADRLRRQLASYPHGVERLLPPFGAKDFAEVMTVQGAREHVRRTLAEQRCRREISQSRSSAVSSWSSWPTHGADADADAQLRGEPTRYTGDTGDSEAHP